MSLIRMTTTTLAAGARAPATLVAFLFVLTRGGAEQITPLRRQPQPAGVAV